MQDKPLPPNDLLRHQILQRRSSLEAALSHAHEPQLLQLLQDVDAALARIDQSTYGLCTKCRLPLERDRLAADPLVALCLDCLTPTQQRALERDLQLAASIQRSLLPPLEVHAAGWQSAYHYEPAGVVSGDYCDLIPTQTGRLYFIVGDVAGKGVAASMLMVHLHAVFRTLTAAQPPLHQLLEQASRLFCESSLPTLFATLVCGWADRRGQMEICNAGHLPPLLVQRGQITRLNATGLPLGLFCEERFSTVQVELSPGDYLALYTDGLTECRDGAGAEFGEDRLEQILKEAQGAPLDIVQRCRADLAGFRLETPRHDDLTLMVLQRTAL